MIEVELKDKFDCEWLFQFAFDICYGVCTIVCYNSEEMKFQKMIGEFTIK